jgi:RNA recognition motif-containing protein
MNQEIKCRKCNGSHLTIKCSQYKKVSTNETLILPTNERFILPTNERFILPTISKNTLDSVKIISNISKNILNETVQLPEKINKYSNYKKFKVKINNLPLDITKEELYTLLYEWGYVKYININVYNDEAVAFIEFKEQEQCDYLIKALNNTNFEYRIIKIVLVD